MRYMIDVVMLSVTDAILVYDYIYIVAGSRIYTGPEKMFWLTTSGCANKNLH